MGTHLKPEALEEQINHFEIHMNEFNSSGDQYSLENCEGSAIEYINTGFSRMDTLAVSFNDLLHATDYYLYKVKNNIAACEADNSVDGEN